MNELQDRTIALAAILQIASQVQRLARTGLADESVFEVCLNSVLVLDAINTQAVYGGMKGVSSGLSLLSSGVLISPDGESIEQLRYAMSLLTLTEQLQRSSSLFQDFGGEVEGLSAVTKDDLPQACSDIYQKYISGLQPQIIVQGEEDFLQQPDIPIKIRSLLLAGIRAGALWKQKGGGRFKLLWERTRMRNTAAGLLAQL